MQETSLAYPLSGKRFLITQPLIHGINGSTIVTLELAEFLQNHGAHVDVFTLTLQDPALSLFRQRDIRVRAAQSNPSYKLSDYDFIWVHSQVLPLSIIKGLSKPHSKYPAFIFLHMSSMDWIPDEHPFIYKLEEQLSSLSLYICEEVRKTNLDYFYKEPSYDYFRNPAPSYFCIDKKNETKDVPERLLLVSNYPPKELTDALAILKNRGIFVETLGERGDRYELLSPEMLNRFDAVITIAKTTQCCLVANIPVYVYGKFGGAGWLSSNNFEKLKSTNFCGSEGFQKKDAQKIASEIISGYKAGKRFQDSHFQDFLTDFLIDNRIVDILSTAKPRKITPFDLQYTKMLESASLFMRVRFEEWTNVRNLEFDIKSVHNSRSWKVISTLAKLRRQKDK